MRTTEAMLFRGASSCRGVRVDADFFEKPEEVEGCSAVREAFHRPRDFGGLGDLDEVGILSDPARELHPVPKEAQSMGDRNDDAVVTGPMGET